MIKKKIENIERIEILLNNFLLNQNTILTLKILEKKRKKFDRMRFKYNRKIFKVLIKEILLLQKLNEEIKNKNVRFFTVLNEY